MWRLTSIALLLGAAALHAEQQGSGASPSHDRQGAAPTALTGCLRAGQGAQAFVLSVTGDTPPGSAASAAEGAGARATGTTGTSPAKAPAKTATYQLVAADPAVDLRRFVGQRVTVKGEADPASKTTVTTNNSAASEAPTDAAPRDEATPVVTTTEATRVQAQRFRVTSVVPTGSRCEQ